MLLVYTIEVDNKMHDNKFLEFMLKVNGYKFYPHAVEGAIPANRYNRDIENEMREQRQPE